MTLISALSHAFWMASVMFWDIFWGLCLGFFFSVIIEELVPKDEMSRLLPDSSPLSLAIASALGAGSSPCSYAAVAMGHSMIRKGANFIAAMAFQFATTNLVLELSVLLIVLLGWQFAAAEFIGPLMIVFLASMFQLLLQPKQVEAAVAQAKRNVAGFMEGHAQMSMAKHDGAWRERLTSKSGRIAISHGFVMSFCSVQPLAIADPE